MTQDEVKVVLADCAVYDFRTVGKTEVLAWEKIIGGFTYPEAEEAVIEYYKTHRERIMPSDIFNYMVEKRQQWAWKHPSMGETPPWEIAEGKAREIG